jgi:bifunctional DNA-binding transcriptional regulator/antitoxin component of YhaV-PrlF toxin-antitoxin module
MERATKRTKMVRSLRGGQITIPIDFRRELGINGDSMLKMTLEEGELRITPLGPAATDQGSAWFKQLYEDFAPARAEAIEKGYTEQEINGWIDEAVAAVRAKYG